MKAMLKIKHWYETDPDGMRSTFVKEMRLFGILIYRSETLGCG